MSRHHKASALAPHLLQAVGCLGHPRSALVPATQHSPLLPLAIPLHCLHRHQPLVAARPLPQRQVCSGFWLHLGDRVLHHHRQSDQGIPSVQVYLEAQCQLSALALPAYLTPPLSQPARHRSSAAHRRRVPLGSRSLQASQAWRLALATPRRSLRRQAFQQVCPSQYAFLLNRVYRFAKVEIFPALAAGFKRMQAMYVLNRP